MRTTATPDQASTNGLPPAQVEREPSARLSKHDPVTPEGASLTRNDEGFGAGSNGKARRQHETAIPIARQAARCSTG